MVEFKNRFNKKNIYILSSVNGTQPTYISYKLEYCGNLILTKINELNTNVEKKRIPNRRRHDSFFSLLNIVSLFTRKILHLEVFFLHLFVVVKINRSTRHVCLFVLHSNHVECKLFSKFFCTNNKK